MNKNLLLVLLVFLMSGNSYSQVVKSVVLDSVMIESVKQGFDVDDFIQMVQQDTSFLKGFRYLRNSPHSIASEVKVFDKNKKKVKASRNRIGYQKTSINRRWVKIESEEMKGKFYNRKGVPHMYTVELFDEVFYYKDSLDLVNLDLESNYNFEQSNRSNIDKLKQMVFNPGSDIKGVPVVGNRLSVFSDEMAPYYNYSISSRLYNDSIACYVFSCSVKDTDESYPVLRFMNTWFDRATFNIIYRDYHYSYAGLLFEFDVGIEIKMKYAHEKLYPGMISYSGFWDIPFKKQETVDLKVEFQLNN